MKIIDFERKGNLVRFYLGNDSFDESFDHWVGAKGVHKFYFGDHMEPSAMAATNPHF